MVNRRGVPLIVLRSVSIHNQLSWYDSNHIPVIHGRLLLHRHVHISTTSLSTSIDWYNPIFFTFYSISQSWKSSALHRVYRFCANYPKQGRYNKHSLHPMCHVWYIWYFEIGTGIALVLCLILSFQVQNNKVKSIIIQRPHQAYSSYNNQWHYSTLQSLKRIWFEQTLVVCNRMEYQWSVRHYTVLNTEIIILT